MKKRIAGLVLSLLLILQMSMPAVAVRSVYFMAVNDNILPMTDATMPFWSSGTLYIPSSIFTGDVRKDVDVGYVYNPGRQLLILYNAAKQRLEFDMSRNHVGDSEGNIYYRRALVRGGEVFVPAVLVAEYFGLVYSTTALDVKVAGEDEAWMVWLRTPDRTLPEKTFADAASSMMRDRYEAYNRTQSGAEEQPDTPQKGETTFSGKSVYLCFRAENGEETAALLNELDQAGRQAAFYCTAEFLEQEGDLLRRMAATGHTIGLLADGEHEALSVKEQLSLGNDALYRATCGKTRMVYLENADEDLLEAVGEAGYCCLEPQIDHTGYGLRRSADVSLLLQRLASRRDNTSVWLGERASALGLREFLADMRVADDRALALTETSV